jgi:hypothetical protein
VRGPVDRIVEVPSDGPAAPVQPIHFKVDVLNGVRSSREDLHLHRLDGTGRVRDGIVLGPDGPEPARLLSRPRGMPQVDGSIPGISKIMNRMIKFFCE